MDENPNFDTKLESIDQSPFREIERLQAELADAKFEIEGCCNVILRLSAEIRRLRERYHVAAEGDR